MSARVAVEWVARFFLSSAPAGLQRSGSPPTKSLDAHALGKSTWARLHRRDKRGEKAGSMARFYRRTIAFHFAGTADRGSCRRRWP
ncbi:hypothetical protein BDY21DRAFT_341056 [Lineolata rhizophorae]|uniref:Uncharacterized protein n=1 Tax=Lineolata rhizophorae TaxID=578093 RepID=A0A6A6P484_9PEZI|nr:hypothetical protein BDY21DRAFT_341056 [Lineolata rhizophorae]